MKRKLPKPGTTIYSALKGPIGEIDHGTVVFLVGRKYEKAARMLLERSYGRKDWKFIY